MLSNRRTPIIVTVECFMSTYSRDVAQVRICPLVGNCLRYAMLRKTFCFLWTGASRGLVISTSSKMLGILISKCEENNPSVILQQGLFFVKNQTCYFLDYYVSCYLFLFSTHPPKVKRTDDESYQEILS